MYDSKESESGVVIVSGLTGLSTSKTENGKMGMTCDIAVTLPDTGQRRVHLGRLGTCAHLCTWTEWSLGQWGARRDLGNRIIEEERMHFTRHWAAVSRKVRNRASKNIVGKADTE